MNKTTFEIAPTREYRYAVHSLVCFGLSIAVFFFNWYFCLFFGAITIILFLVKSGMTIDAENLKYRKYDVLFGKKIGSWNTIQDSDTVILKKTNVSQRMNSRGTSVTMNIKTFDVVLKSGDQLSEICEFKDLKSAKAMFDYLRSECGLEARNLTDSK